MKRTRLENWICAVEDLPELSRPVLEDLQLRRLNALLARERARGGFYRGLPERLESLDELSSLPFTTAQQLSANAPGLLLTSQAEVRRIISGATSGTTGPAKRIFYTERDLEHTVGFFAAGIGEMAAPGEAVLVAMPFSGRDGLGELSFCELDALLDAHRPGSYIGMSVPLLSLLRWRRSNGRGLYLKRALVSGDACPEGVLAEIEALLGTRLFPHYGSREMCMGGAVTCQAHEGMHLRENHVLAEIVDESGARLPDGERGELVITTLDMEAMPLIRYRTGDYTRFLPGKCPCGGVTRRIERVSRADNSMERLDGELFRLPGLIDYSASDTGCGLRIDAVGDVSAADIRAAAPFAAIGEVRVRAPESGWRGSYAGKRHILTET